MLEKDKFKINIIKDGDGYLAEVVGEENLYAWGTTKAEAVNELLNVVNMIVDFHLEQLEREKKIKKALSSNIEKYAI